MGKAVLQVVSSEGLVAHADATGRYLKDNLEALKARHEFIGDVRGHGLFLGIELVENRGTKAPAAVLARTLPDRLKDEGILIGLSGRHGNVLKIRPPLVFDTAQANQLIDTLDRVFLQNS